MTRLRKAIRSIIQTCLNLRAQESLVVVSEASLADVGEAIWTCGRKITRHPVFLKYTRSAGLRYGLPPAVRSSLRDANCAVVLTPGPIDVTTFDEFVERGTRVALLSSISSAILERAIDLDYKSMAKISRRLADVFSIGRNLHLTSPTGTDVRFSISNSKGRAETGLAKKGGELIQLPAGEACITPNRRNMQGQIAIDCIAGQPANNDKPVILKIQKGHISQIQGAKPAERLRRDIRKFGKNGRTVTELGIGTNEALRLGNSLQEDEKVSGTAHITIGEGQITKVQGKINHAVKAMIFNPSLTLDGKQILHEGRIVI